MREESDNKPRSSGSPPSMDRLQSCQPASAVFLVYRTYLASAAHVNPYMGPAAPWSFRGSPPAAFMIQKTRRPPSTADMHNR